MAVCAPARADAFKTGQALLQKKFMVCVRGCGKQDASFDEGKDTMDTLYRLLEDDPHSALNAGQTAACTPIQGRSRLDQASGREHMASLVQADWCPLLRTELCLFRLGAGWVYDPLGASGIVCDIGELCGFKNWLKGS